MYDASHTSFSGKMLGNSAEVQAMSPRIARRNADLIPVFCASKLTASRAGYPTPACPCPAAPLLVSARTGTRAQHARVRADFPSLPESGFDFFLKALPFFSLVHPVHHHQRALHDFGIGHRLTLGYRASIRDEPGPCAISCRQSLSRKASILAKFKKIFRSSA